MIHSQKKLSNLKNKHNMANELIRIESEVKTLMSRLPRKGSCYPALILIDTIISELENKGVFIDNRDFFILKEFRKECSTDKNFKKEFLVESE